MGDTIIVAMIGFAGSGLGALANVIAAGVLVGGLLCIIIKRGANQR